MDGSSTFCAICFTTLIILGSNNKAYLLCAVSSAHYESWYALSVNVTRLTYVYIGSLLVLRVSAQHFVSNIHCTSSLIRLWFSWYLCAYYSYKITVLCICVCMCMYIQMNAGIVYRNKACNQVTQSNYVRCCLLLGKGRAVEWEGGWIDWFISINQNGKNNQLKMVNWSHV